MCLSNSTANWPATVQLSFEFKKKRCWFSRHLRRNSAIWRDNWSFDQNGVMFRAMRRASGWIAKKSAASLNPSQVETTLVQLSEQWPASVPPLADVVEQFPLGDTALLHLLAVSSSCATRLTRNPETLLWLCQTEVSLAPRGYAEMLSELHALAGDSVATQDFASLRFRKGREMTRVALLVSRVFQPIGKNNPRNLFDSAPGRLTFSSRSAPAPGRLGRAFGPVAREHGKLLCRFRRNMGTDRSNQGTRNRR